MKNKPDFNICRLRIIISYGNLFYLYCLTTYNKIKNILNSMKASFWILNDLLPKLNIYVPV